MSHEANLLSGVDSREFVEVEVEWHEDVFEAASNLPEINKRNAEDEISSFLVIKPTAVDERQQIERIVSSRGFSILDCWRDEEYIDLAKHLYGIPSYSEENSYLWLMVLKSYYQQEKLPGIVVVLQKDDYENKEQYDRDIKSLKHTIRDKIGRSYFRCVLKGSVIRTWIHPVHAPEFEDLDQEYTTVRKHAELFKTEM